MNKFIELTVGGEKHLFHTDTIFEIEPERSGCRVYQTVYAPGSADFTNVVVDDSYEQVKAMLVGGEDNGSHDIITDDDVIKMSNDFDKMCMEKKCDKCKYNPLDDEFKCGFAFAKEWLNKKLKGEHR